MTETATAAYPGRRDMILYALVLALAFAGLLILYPASAVHSQREFGDAAFFIKRQGRWFALGIIALLIFATVPLKFLRKLALPGMLFSIPLLGLVFMPGIGHGVSSSSDNTFHRWIGLGPFTVQPSEFAKLAMAVYLADVLSRGDRLETEYDIKRLAPPLTLVGAALVAIVLEPQFGTTVCLLAVIAALFCISGFPLIRLGAVFLSSVPLLYLLVYLAPYRWSRFRVWLDPLAHRHEGGYQLVTSFRAFREGGVFGQDLAQGFAHRYLTFGHTDFILALFGEDFGLLGTGILIGLFLALLWRAYLLLRRVEYPFAFLLGSAVLVMLVFQALLNMFVVTGLAPTTGVSLPFISYGGSSLIVTLSFCGILINVSRYA